MEAYSYGNGHVDLANLLNIPKAESLAIGGSANSRILRTTLKHSYLTEYPTFYVLGMTFLSRLEVPILENQTEFEGRWTNPQNQQFKKNWQYGWSDQDTEKFIDIKLKSEIYSVLDRLEDLMYKIITLIRDLKHRGHGVLIYQQADQLHLPYLTDARLQLFKEFPEIVDAYAWRAVPWQFEQGVPAMYEDHSVPMDIKHPASGHHHKLNEFLVDYIVSRNMLTQ